MAPSTSSNEASLPQRLLAPSSSDSSLFQLVWLIARLVAGGLMIHNGIDKLGNVEGFATNVVSFIGLPFPVFFTYCAAYVEIISAGLLMVGFLTRANALALLGTMAVAIFFHLKGDGLKIAPLETASLYAAAYLFFLVNGPGTLSLDAILAKKFDS